ncbi:MAG: hypothetical protein ACE366_13350 [Bradymonadia bacterium]
MITALALVTALLAPPELQKALDHFDFGQFAEACTLLEPLKSQPGLTRQARITVLSRLGACHHYQGETAQARVAFQALLDADPSHALDPVQHPPELLAFFRDIKAGYARTPPAKPTREVPPSKTAAEGDGSKATASAPAQKSHWVALSPFGAGQFQNQQVSKGVTMASLQTVSLGVGLVGLMLFEAEKDSGSFLGGGTFKNTEKANTYQSLYLAGFVGFAGVWIYSIADAFYHFDSPPTVTVTPTGNGLSISGRF